MFDLKHDDNAQDRRHNKIKTNEYNTVGAVPKSNRKVVESGTIEYPNTQIHDPHFPELVLALYNKNGGVKLRL